MGKQKRHKAESSTMPDSSEHLCCLPHCETPGHKLACGHMLCGLDLLKMTQFSTQLSKLVLTCPMCRKMDFLDYSIVSKSLNEQPLKSAVFKCACSNKHCDRMIPAFIRPCKSHGAYNCDACVGLGSKGASYMQLISRDDDDGPNWNQPGWGMSEEEFLNVIQGFRRQHGPLTADDISGLRAARAAGFNPYPSAQ